MISEEELFEELTLRVVVDDFGTRGYYNAAGQLHREEGPAVKRAGGTKEWRINGELHREDGPAVEYASGCKAWYQNGLRHRINGPAIEWPDGSVEWWLNGKRYTKQNYLAQLKALGQTA